MAYYRVIFNEIFSRLCASQEPLRKAKNDIPVKISQSDKVKVIRFLNPEQNQSAPLTHHGPSHFCLKHPFWPGMQWYNHYYFHNNHHIHNRVAEVARSREGPSPKSLDSDENLKR